MTIHISLHDLPDVRSAAQTCQEALDSLGIEGEIFEDHRHAGMDLRLPDTRAAEALGEQLRETMAGISRCILQSITIDGGIVAEKNEEITYRTVPRIALDQAAETT